MGLYARGDLGNCPDVLQWPTPLSLPEFWLLCLWIPTVKDIPSYISFSECFPPFLEKCFPVTYHSFSYHMWSPLYLPVQTMDMERKLFQPSLYGNDKVWFGFYMPGWAFSLSKSSTRLKILPLLSNKEFVLPFKNICFQIATACSSHVASL